jgi:hypothetical protein
MTLQTDLQEAVTRIQADTLILHNIVHGDNQTTITTEGGPVKTVAKAVKDIQDNIQIVLDGLTDTSVEINQLVTQVTDLRNDAEGFAQAAQLLAASLNLPTDLTGLAHMMLAVKADESGYEPVPSVARFYGLKRSGAKLYAESGNGNFNTADYIFWFFALPGVSFSVSASGHLQIII